MKTIESAELFSIIVPKWSKAVSRLFGNFRPNVALLGNDWPHLHAHLIPRFFDTIKKYEIEFTDPNPKGNYSPYTKREISLDVLLRIKEAIKREI